MKYECLNIDNQLCFPLYALSHQITKKYKPILDEIDLTYTQYITMMVMCAGFSLAIYVAGKKKGGAAA